QAAFIGEAEKAAGYAVVAGDRAMQLVAYEDAASQYGMALSALAYANPPDEHRRCELLLRLGDAQRRAGDTDESKATYRQAGDIARKLRAADGGSEAGQLLAFAALGCGS